MTPPSTLRAQPSPFLGPPLTAGHLLKPLDFTSTQTIFLFPPMSSSKLKGSSSHAPDSIDDAFYVAPKPSRFWAALNHSGTRLFVNVLRRLSANVEIPANVASNAMNVGIRATVRISLFISSSLLTDFPSAVSLRPIEQQRPARRHPRTHRPRPSALRLDSRPSFRILAYPNAVDPSTSLSFSYSIRFIRFTDPNSGPPPP